MKSGLGRLSTIFAAAAMTLGTISPALAQQAPAAPDQKTTITTTQPAAQPATAPAVTTPKAEDSTKSNLPPFPFTKQMLDETDGGKRIVRLEGAVTSKSAAAVEAQLIALDREAPGKPILLAINSPGGEVQAGLDIIDVMGSLQSPVYTVGFNMCASMAAVILTAGESGHRTVFPNTALLYHEMSASGIEGKVSEQEQILRDEKSEEAKLIAVIAEHSGQSKEDVLNFIYGKDRWVTAADAKRFGFIDTVEKPSHAITPPSHVEKLRTFHPDAPPSLNF
ncbi:MAG TPA: ATP-dependent Clp protease proteolytic subunit [Patescibacteria group bacterium]|jgi:ATP-dependent Clp protease protease subunit|nr:ATP-dependent Clp protease proteolytic subunit [Patescibacteria group bacterium]